jgi:hypothetical protein
MLLKYEFLMKNVLQDTIYHKKLLYKLYLNTYSINTGTSDIMKFRDEEFHC